MNFILFNIKFQIIKIYYEFTPEIVCPENIKILKDGILKSDF